MLLRGNTTPTHTPLSSLCPRRHLYYYYYYYYPTTSDFITVPSPLSSPSTSSLLPSHLDGALAARHERRGERPTGGERNCKIRALQFVPETRRCRDGSFTKRQSRPLSLPSFYLIYGVPVDVPCMCLLFSVGSGTLLFL